MIGYALLSQKAAAVLGNQYVILDANAAKILVCFDSVKTQELLAMSTVPPLVNKLRNEVDAWLVSHHKAFFQLSAHP